ncbi:hypothetical protein [Mesorhizobium sangaii]|uniref:Uncharacterized protein n=1 Tax=Mesorhizobium sangaii TaxID=505389 RepID=A0A841PBT0_9HYPH|nr:hypothetical protein [Mesorhizobium sangaii]MBB6407752.1 hypothetical protein [Mesorhizobium sangaii]
MAGQNRTREELVQLFKGQTKALEASSTNFDTGEEWEAERLSTTIFNLVFDGGPLVSLLTRLGVKETLKFVSSGRMPTGLPPPSVAMPSLLIMRRDNAGSRFIPKLGNGPPLYRHVPFDDWWKNELIYQEKASGQLNRMRLVLALRHQDGGSHIGNLTDGVYVHLKKGAGWQLKHADGRIEPVTNLIASSVRQVAWELMETLKQLSGDLQ